MNMKKEIKQETPLYLKINSEVKKQFQKWCIDNNTTLTDKLNQLMVEFLKNNNYEK